MLNPDSPALIAVLSDTDKRDTFCEQFDRLADTGRRDMTAHVEFMAAAGHDDDTLLERRFSRYHGRCRPDFLDEWAIMVIEKANASQVAAVLTALRSTPVAELDVRIACQLTNETVDVDAFADAVVADCRRRIKLLGPAGTLRVAELLGQDESQAALLRALRAGERADIKAWAQDTDLDSLRARFWYVEAEIARCNARRADVSADRALTDKERTLELALIDVEQDAWVSESAALWHQDIDGGRGILNQNRLEPQAVTHARFSALWLFRHLKGH